MRARRWTGLYDTVKPDLVWEMAGGMAPKENVKAILILANAAADCVPRGGVVTITGDVDAFTITATGKRIYLQDDLVKGIEGRGARPDAEIYANIDCRTDDRFQRRRGRCCRR